MKVPGFPDIRQKMRWGLDIRYELDEKGACISGNG